jgi:hypothetical protein
LQFELPAFSEVRLESADLYCGGMTSMNSGTTILHHTWTVDGL